MTPPAYLDSLGMFDYGGTCFHCVHMTKEDLELFARLGGFIVTNPGSNAKLASGIAPLTDMLDCGISVGIGTDGPASNNCLDFFREMFLATALQKLRLKDAAALDAEQVLQMAVTGGAHAMGLSDCDCLAPGKRADFRAVHPKKCVYCFIESIFPGMFYSGKKGKAGSKRTNGAVADKGFLYGTGNGYAFRRKPTEGNAGKMAFGTSQSPDYRRTDKRGGCGRAGLRISDYK